MPVIDMTINQIEDVTKNNRRKRHEAPVLAQAFHAKGLSNECWVDAEEEAISKAGQTRQEAKNMRIIDLGPANLGRKKYCTGHEEAPKTAHSGSDN